MGAKSKHKQMKKTKKQNLTCLNRTINNRRINNKQLSSCLEELSNKSKGLEYNSRFINIVCCPKKGGRKKGGRKKTKKRKNKKKKR
jgi:hypothetical protein